jgi:hypothetical protein
MMILTKKSKVYRITEAKERSMIVDLSFRNKTVLIDGSDANIFKIFVLYQILNNWIKIHKNINIHLCIDQKYEFLVDLFSNHVHIKTTNSMNNFMRKAYYIIDAGGYEVNSNNIVDFIKIFIKDTMLDIYSLNTNLNSLYSNIVGLNLVTNQNDILDVNCTIQLYEYIKNCALNIEYFYNTLKEINLNTSKNKEVKNESDIIKTSKDDVVIIEYEYDNYHTIFKIIKSTKLLKLFIGKENELFLIVATILDINRCILIDDGNLKWIYTIFNIPNKLNINNNFLINLENCIKNVNEFELDKFYVNNN